MACKERGWEKQMRCRLREDEIRGGGKEQINKPQVCLTLRGERRGSYECFPDGTRGKQIARDTVPFMRWLE